jgi:2,3-dihydro-2,3-dihydroxybenzoate dehydrogenase
MSEFAGKVDLVTGAAMGIGAAVAELRARRGVQLAFVDCDIAPLEELAARLRVAGHKVETIVADVRENKVQERTIGKDGTSLRLVRSAQ